MKDKPQMKDKRTKLIHEAATKDADGVKWRDRTDKWLRLHGHRPMPVILREVFGNAYGAKYLPVSR